MIVIPHVRATFIVFLTLLWVQAGVREMMEHWYFVDDHCYGEQATSGKYIMSYCLLHRRWGDWTSISALMHGFCLAGRQSMLVSAMLVLALQEALVSGLWDSLSKPLTPPKYTPESGADN